MNLIVRVIAAAALAACALAARAETLSVNLAATFEMAPLTAGPTLANLAFTIDTPVSAIQQIPGVALLQNVPIHARFVSEAGTGDTELATTEVAWFSFPDRSYFGIDVRLSNLLTPGDVMQFIWTTPAAPYGGTDTAPLLTQQSLTGLSGAVCYYAAGSGACTYAQTFSDGVYSLSAVPEPGAALLLLAGLAGMAGVARRHPAR